MRPPELFIGLMSGTSLDGVDGVLAAFPGARRPLEVRAHAARSMPSGLREEFFALNTPGADEFHRGALAANALVRLYAEVVDELLATGGVGASDVRAIGAHGQTVRHRPGAVDGVGYTLQLNNPALLAELTGIDVVADFRSRDLAAGGQGAPLVPLFHQAVFGRAGQMVGVLNLGGIANLSLLHPHGEVLGFDCGPGNALMDGWCQLHTGAQWDEGGRWAASGRVMPALLDACLAEPYFQRSPPKSTGRDLFHPAWLAERLALAGAEAAAPADVQATLLELTARSVAQDVHRHAPGLKTLIVCGGGALNGQLMQRLAALLPEAKVQASAAHGLPPLQVEAAAFAWLARKAVAREALATQNITGACGARVLGAVYPR